jgi:P pilus assembly chaperone PapD
MTRRHAALLALVACAALATSRAHAVLVSPLAIFVDGQTRTTEVTLANPSPTPEEVTIDVRYGFPTTDTLTESVVTPTFGPDSVLATAPSAARFVRVFPRRVVLQPGQTQVVRIFASPPPGLADGEYWARFMATSKQLPDTAKKDGESVGITFAIVTSIPIWYRKGPVKTILALDTLAARATRDSLDARIVLARGGNASWLGTATFTLSDARGRTVREWPVMTAIFPAQYKRRLRWALDGVPPGAYTLTAAFKATRGDMRPQDVLPAPEVSRAVPVVIP